MGIATAIIGGVASIGSAALGASAASSAASQQAAAQQQAAQLQLQMYNSTKQTLSPWVTGGSSALGQLLNLYGLGAGGSGPTAQTAANATSALENYPGYQFTFNQGLQALNRSAAAQGLTLSGAQLQAAQQYGQQAALANAWNPYISQLGSLSSIGENAGAMVGNAGTSAANAAGGYLAGAGSSLAAGTMGAANAMQGGLQGALYSSLMGYNLANQAPQVSTYMPSEMSSGFENPGYLSTDSGFDTSGLNSYVPSM